MLSHCLFAWNEMWGGGGGGGLRLEDGLGGVDVVVGGNV